MRLSAEKTNENVDNHDELSTSSGTQEKVKSRRKILNPFKRLSLKRTKSLANRYALFKSESDIDSNIENQPPLIQNSPIFAVNNPFHSETALPYATACTSQTIHSVVFYPNESPESHQYEITDDKPQNLIFNTSDLPDISDYERNHTPFTSPNNDLIRSNLSESKANQTSKLHKSYEKKYSVVPTNFISDTNNNINISLTLSLKEVADIVNYLQENELHIKRLISKYIRDESFEEELLYAVNAHAKVQIDNERRAYKLAQELFSQDLETKNTKLKALQNSLETVVQINRLLEEEIENLKTEHEKIIIDFGPESQHCVYHKKYKEDILRNNNELRLRVKHLINEFKKLEGDLRTLQTQNECLVSELANANSQIRTYKDLLQKSVGDHEIEQAASIKQIENNEQIIKASMEAGDTLMEDLESIKRQVKQMPFSLNWPKFKCRGSSVVDLLHLARSCINELCRELINTYLQITVKNKEKETQNLELVKLNNELQKSRRSDTEIHSKNEEISSLRIQIQVLTQKIHLLETELEMYKKDNTTMAERFYQEKNSVTNLTKNVEELTNQISANDIEISGLNTKLLDAITENSGLKYNIDSLKKLLDESKISKVVQELVETQEKCSHYQAQFYEVQIEKANLLDLSKKFEAERENFLKYQQSYCEHLQLQQKELEDLTRQNVMLKEQLRIEQEIVKEKNAQLFQQIQESNIMKTVQSQYSTELSKNQILESNAMNSNFELNRLTVVAEYNNMISQQLKEAINSKDKIISELKNNIDVLNTSERKSVEEKSALCQELTEASHIIKELQTNLKHEKEKTQQLANEKSTLHVDASRKIEELHTMLLDERHAIREILNDHKNITTQRNNLLSQQKEFIAQMEVLKESHQSLKSNQDQFKTKCQKYEEQCEGLTKELREAHKKIESMVQKVKNDAMEYENKLSVRDNLIENMTAEKDQLDNTIKYLQNNIQKLQNEVDDLRNAEMNYKYDLKTKLDSITQLQENIEEQKNVLKECSEEQTELEQKLNDALKNNNDLLNEYNKFMKESKLNEEKLNDALKNNNDLLNEYNKFMKESKLNEEKLQKEIKTYKKLNETKSKSIECLAKDSKEKLKVIENAKSECEALKNDLQKFEEIQKELEEKSKLFENSLQNQQELNTKMSNLITENEICQKKLKQFSDIISLYKSQVEITNRNRENEIEICRSCIEKITEEVKNEKQEMLNDLHKLSEKFNELNTKYSEKCSRYDSLKSSYKNLSERLTKTVTVALEEKVLRQNEETEIALLENEVDELKLKLECANKLIQELNEAKSKASIMQENEDFLQHQLDETKKLYSDTAVECKTLDFELKEANKKLERLEKLINSDDRYAAQALEERAKLLQVAEKNAEILEERLKKMRVQLQLTGEINSSLKSEISLLYRNMQVLEFQKCELTLRYHELNSKYHSERNLNATLKDSHQHLLASMCELSKDNPTAQSVSQHLILPLK